MGVYRQNQNLHRSAPFWAWVKVKTLWDKEDYENGFLTIQEMHIKYGNQGNLRRHYIYLKNWEITRNVCKEKK